MTERSEMDQRGVQQKKPRKETKEKNKAEEEEDR